MPDVVGMLVEILQEEVHEPGRNAGAPLDEFEPHGLVLQAVAHLHRTPGELHVLTLGGDDFGCGSALLQRANVHLGILLHPVRIVLHQRRSVLLVFGDGVGLAQRHEPVVAVQLPAQLVVLDGPVAPVDVVAVEIGLVALVCMELML